MSKYKKQLIGLIILSVLSGLSTAYTNTWQLEENLNWDLVATGNQGEFLTAIVEVQKIVNENQTKAAKEAFEKLQENFPDFSGPDLDLFIKAELFLSSKKFTTAARTFDKLLKKYPESKLRDVAIGRMFEIGKIYLGGQKKVLLGFIKISGYAEGIRILEKVTDYAGIDSQIGTEAAIAIAKNYEKREKFHEAYLKWWEISSQWQTGTVGRDALLGMAQAKHAIYNKNPEQKRSYYDASCLRSARSYYERFKLLFPDDAKEINVDGIIDEINEQLAYKEFVTARYYQQTGSQQSANLYYDMVTTNWPDTKGAQKAEEILTENSGK